MRLDAILDDRRQVGQQGLEDMDRFAGGSALGARLGAGLRRDLGGLHHRLPRGLRRVRIGDPTVADSILDRLVHHAHYFELSGDSLRKQRGREILGAGQDSA